ncbi:MAG: threonylcarbamoyl-AMP synthase, partial [Acidobacteria bacterium]|nr:threonylcarbamoyl-AMP synthase [Acidobacteriota bacterium]
MKTVLTRSPKDAAVFVKQGGITAFPTETVYGLGANIFDEASIFRIFEAKNRPSDNPLIAHIGDLDQLGDLVSETNDAALKLIETFFPGPLTLVLPKKEGIPAIATAGLETIGVRMPDNGLALEFLRECSTPVVAPSANLSGKPSPTTWRAVLEDLDGRIDCILQGETTKYGLESTVVDCTGKVPLVLRSGALSIEDIQKAVSSTQVYQLGAGEKPRSPGMKHRHYSPAADILLVSNTGVFSAGSGRNAYIGLN